MDYTNSTKNSQNLIDEDIRCIIAEISKQIDDKFREQDLKLQQQQSEQINNLTKAIYMLAQNLNKH